MYFRTTPSLPYYYCCIQSDSQSFTSRIWGADPDTDTESAEELFRGRQTLGPVSPGCFRRPRRQIGKLEKQMFRLLPPAPPPPLISTLLLLRSSPLLASPVVVTLFASSSYF